MNRIQMGIVWLWLCLLAVCTLFPPWVRVGQPVGDGRHLDQIYVGRSFLFAPPELSESIRFRESKQWDEMDDGEKRQMEDSWRTESRAHHVVEVGRLLASWGIISLICFAIIFAFCSPCDRDRKAKSEANE